MPQKENAKPENEGSAGKLSESTHRLILHNDDQHTFDYVIKALIEICDHSPEQAEQCTYLAHYKGTCMVKQGSRGEMEALHRKFSGYELKTTIDNHE